MHQEPLVFTPLFFERVWGGRVLEEKFAKPLPPAVPIGESWEIVDREEAQSIVSGGALDGQSLNTLWNAQRAELFGSGYAGYSERFPLLVKLLDARDKLSVQVHPPASVADALGGEPKTEMWFLMACDEGADLYAGLKNGVTRQAFEQALNDGTVADLVYRLEVKPGDTMFIQSGRIHAIGAGNVILEVQQNSDTTYRVFDWNRTGLDGKARELHVSESLESIDFEDFEPLLQQTSGETLVDDPLFLVEKWELSRESRRATSDGCFALFAVTGGSVQCGEHTFQPGSFFIAPAFAAELEIHADGPATLLRTTIPLS